MSEKITYIQAIKRVLRNSNRPLTAKEIYNQLLESKKIDFGDAKTPWTAIRARISEEIKYGHNDSIFVRAKSGAYTLREKSELIPKNRKFFFVIEGLDGSGKTEVARQLANILRQSHGEDVMFTFEPHDPSSAGYFIRQALGKSKRLVSDELFALAFATNRADHYERKIKPFLFDHDSDRRVCICDRYYLSSLVYQSTSSFTFEDIFALNFAAKKPDLTIFLNANTSTCRRRMNIRQEEKELFDSDLDRKREQYLKAIKFLRKENDETIIEVNAENELLQVLEDIGKILTGEHGADWIIFNRPLMLWEPQPDPFSLNGDFKIATFSRKFSNKWRGILNLKESYIQESFETLKLELFEEINQLNDSAISSLFIDFLNLMGYQHQDDSRLPWTEVAAYHLNYKLPKLPEGILLHGVAFILGRMHKQLVITKKVLDLERNFDFMIILDLRVTQHVDSYNRDPVIEGNRQLPPATITINRKDLADIILVFSLRQFLNGQDYSIHLLKPKVKALIDRNQLSQYWGYSKNINLLT